MLNSFAFWGFGFGLSLIFVVVVALIFVFEVWMLVSAITNKHISSQAKALWIIGMLLIHPIVAIAYYFTDYKKTL